MAIRSFADPMVEKFFRVGKIGKKAPWQGVKKIVLRKLDMIHYANSIQDLRSPPHNHLEALKGDLKGFHSIRVNDQWRVIFRWEQDEAHQVDVVDYH